MKKKGGRGERGTNANQQSVVEDISRWEGGGRAVTWFIKLALSPHRGFSSNPPASPNDCKNHEPVCGASVLPGVLT